MLEDQQPWSESWAAAILTSRHCVSAPHDQVSLDLALAAATPSSGVIVYYRTHKAEQLELVAD